MTIHWKLLPTSGKIEAIKYVWQPGMSAAKIASRFDGATRNAVIGVYQRYRKDLFDYPLCTPTEVSNAIRKARRAREGSPPIAPRALATPMAPHVAGVPLALLAPHQCKWPVNDAARGESHLFCASPAEKSYCAFHASRSVSQHKGGEG